MTAGFCRRLISAMLRRLLFILSVLSLLLSAATISLWIRSYRWQDNLVRQNQPYSEQLLFDSDEGRLWINRICLRQPGGRSSDWRTDKIDLSKFKRIASDDLPEQPIKIFDLLLTSSDGLRERDIFFPHWALAAVLLALSAGLYLQSKQARERSLLRRGLCTQCTYDLRASPDRCPECGKPVVGDVSRTTRAIRHAAWSLELALLCLLIWAAWWINPWRGVTTNGQGLAPEIGIDFYPAWESNRPAGDQHMHRIDPIWGEEWDQAIIHQPNGDYLLVIYEGELSNDNFNQFQRVVLLDRSLRVVKRGRIRAGGKPIRPIDIRADDDSLPTNVRGKWMLGIERRPCRHGPAPRKSPTMKPPAIATTGSNGTTPASCQSIYGVPRNRRFVP